MAKTIVLLSHFKEAQDWVNNFLYDRKVKKVAYILDAKKPKLTIDPNYIFEDKINMEKAGFEVELIDLEALNPKEIEEKLNSFEAMYVKGGNSFYLLNAMKKSGFDKVVHGLVGKGIIYIGESAGSYVACPTIEMANWKHQDRNIVGLKDLDALGLVPFLVTVHYTEELKQLIRLHIDKCKFEVKILTDCDLILVENGVDKLIKLHSGD